MKLLILTILAAIAYLWLRNRTIRFYFLHLKTLSMTLHPDGSLRWERFTGIEIGRFQWGVFRASNIDNGTALAEYQLAEAKRGRA